MGWLAYFNDPFWQLQSVCIFSSKSHDFVTWQFPHWLYCCDWAFVSLDLLTIWVFTQMCSQSPFLLKFALLIYFKYLPRQFISILESIRWKESHCVNHVIDYNVMCLIWHGTILHSVLLVCRICTMTSDWSRNLFLKESFAILLVFGKKKIICHKKYVYSMSISQGLLTNSLCVIGVTLRLKDSLIFP